MLLMTRDHHSPDPSAAVQSPYTAGSKMMPSNHRLVQFSQPIREPKATDKIIYVDGGFDLFRTTGNVSYILIVIDIGHAKLFELAKAKGDYLIVGVHDDKTLNTIRGANYPLMNLQERVLSVLASKWVDEVVIGAPYSITKSMILNGPRHIDLVIHGKTVPFPDVEGADPYAAAKELGIYFEVDTQLPDMTSDKIIARILQHRKQYEERNRKKEAKEAQQFELKQN